jgi:hypothetical protein
MKKSLATHPNKRQAQISESPRTQDPGALQSAVLAGSKKENAKD